MKRAYSKPFLAVESFQLNAAIAGSCSNDTPINHYATSCGYGVIEEGEYWYYFGENNCELDVTGESSQGGETPCYHGPVDGVITSGVAGVTFVWS